MVESLGTVTHSSAFLLPPPPATATAGDGPGPLPTTYALIILNQKLPRFTPLLWQHAKLRLCADGGANRLFDDMPLLFPDDETDVSVVRNRYRPDVIKGDMDSIRREVLTFYTKLGTEIVDESDDQDTTDLHKCITYLCDFVPDEEKPNLCILVAGALGGRFDHEMGNVNALCLFPTIQIVLLSDDCLIELLPSSHRHEIRIQSSVEGPHCGLIPMDIGHTTTTGLQWNLNDTEMRFGGLVSTSNIVTEETVTVQSDANLVWTISLRKQP